MKLRIDPTIYNSDRARKQVLKEVRTPVQDSLRKERAKRKLFKVKHANNDILFNNSDDQNQNIGGHYTLTIGVNPNTDDVAVALLTSLEDIDGIPTKQDKVEKNFIYPIPEDKIIGNSKKSGISIKLYKKNLVEDRNLKYGDLEESNREIKISNTIQTDIAQHLFANSVHKKISKRNRGVVQNMVKIK